MKETKKQVFVRCTNFNSQVYWVVLENGLYRLATKNLTPGKKVYGERLIKQGGKEYRLWDPFRSKFAAVILKGLKIVPIQLNHKVLYLGAASGTTASHVSDIVEEKGHVYCVEFAPRSIRDLINNVCPFRNNISPILADARFPEQYSILVEKVEDIYCDIAQPEQAKVLADNADFFLLNKGWIMLAVKARSVDVTKDPAAIYRRETRILEDRGFDVIEVVHLEPFDKAHAMIIAKR